MQQLEIEYFWPLTEQMELDLDFTPSLDYEREKQKRDISASIIGVGTSAYGATWVTQPSLISSDFVFRPNGVNVGKWEISEKMFIYRHKKPNVIIRFCAKILLGWKWHDEN
jgi:hypothetical protein